MRRAFVHLLPRALPEKGVGVVVLLAWLLGLAAPLWHDHADHSDHADAASRAGHPTADGCCSHVVAPPASGAQLASACADEGSCRNPLHHHHSHEPPRHDVAGCPVCAQLLVRVASPLPPFSIAPVAVRRVAAPAERLSPISERCVFALARGPPPAAGPIATRDRSSSTALLRA